VSLIGELAAEEHLRVQQHEEDQVELALLDVSLVDAEPATTPETVSSATW
jgi:hypothetical protein